ncbi:SAM-dependent methyltransferase [Bacteroides sp. 214]|uniref:tRNA (5-methylaminomethyl-2-thiouridine)(34)-methyltransferase MnmD n=1 Tax=Bacteroides sp. 214 TaxID=2302935 RepID=UPI0013D1F809|nr:tRNA (5-methylaminomethyl-2-thiouridine)(34)-methyltransferase MnmD [Bacteroides sp. 214]NDW13318.1 SAM-dependent methyltransferase [Bacteroides sp. 214]
MNRDRTIVIEKTEDGSATLFVPELDEHYHSVKGARTESQHVFVEMGMKTCKEECVTVLEVGFGTGLNAYLTLLEAEKLGKNVCYVGLELYPVERDTLAALNYAKDEYWEKIHSAKWGIPQFITDDFILAKLNVDLLTYKPLDDMRFAVIYYDAFSPEKQPELWTQAVFDRLYNVLFDDGVLTTYCAKGEVRRMLQQAGFTVERLPGPPGGKREILRATKSVNQ